LHLETVYGPAAVVAEIDSQAARVGISSAEHERRQLTAQARRLKRPATIGDLSRHRQLAADLRDEDLMQWA